MTDVALEAGMTMFCQEKACCVFSQAERWHSYLATSVILPRNAINSTVTTNATTETIKRST